MFSLGSGHIIGLFVSFVPMESAEALIIYASLGFCIAPGYSIYGFCIGYILFIVLWDITQVAYLQLLTCKEPPQDCVEDQ